MEPQVRQRIVGASVLCALAVVFLPMLFDDSEPAPGPIEQSNIPAQPADGFSSRIVPLDTAIPPAEPPPAEASVIPPAVRPTLPTGVDTDTAAGADDGPSPEPVEQADTRVGLTAWAVQLGSFSNEDNAAGLESRLRKAGYSAFVEKLVTEEGTIFRVRVGPELRRADADRLRGQLAGEVELEGIVVRYP